MTLLLSLVTLLLLFVPMPPLHLMSFCALSQGQSSLLSLLTALGYDYLTKGKGASRCAAITSLRERERVGVLRSPHWGRGRESVCCLCVHVLRFQVYCSCSWCKTSTAIFEPRHKRTVFGFPTRVDSNRPTQLQKLARGLKFWV